MPREKEIAQGVKALNLDEELGKKLRQLERESDVIEDSILDRIINDRAKNDLENTDSEPMASKEMQEHFAETIRTSGIKTGTSLSEQTTTTPVSSESDPEPVKTVGLTLSDVDAD